MGVDNDDKFVLTHHALENSDKETTLPQLPFAMGIRGLTNKGIHRVPRKTILYNLAVRDGAEHLFEFGPDPLGRNETWKDDTLSVDKITSAGASAQTFHYDYDAGDFNLDVNRGHFKFTGNTGTQYARIGYGTLDLSTYDFRAARTHEIILNCIGGIPAGKQIFATSQVTTDTNHLSVTTQKGGSADTDYVNLNTYLASGDGGDNHWTVVMPLFKQAHVEATTATKVYLAIRFDGVNKISCYWKIKGLDTVLAAASETISGSLGTESATMKIAWTGGQASGVVANAMYFGGVDASVGNIFPGGTFRIFHYAVYPSHLTNAKCQERILAMGI